MIFVYRALRGPIQGPEAHLCRIVGAFLTFLIDFLVIFRPIFEELVRPILVWEGSPQQTSSNMFVVFLMLMGLYL